MRLTTEEILQRLVAIPTVSSNSNLPLIDWVRNVLADAGVESHLVSDATGLKANIVATLGPNIEGGLVLSGHTDVVPVDGQAWSSDPFKLTLKGTRLHGRGACDMKGFIAVALAKIPQWTKARLRRPVHLMFSYDEEVGCLGAPSMIAAAQSMLPKPAAVIVGEPTGMRLATEHKGICLLRTRVEGIEAHSSLTHQGVSAVMLASELIALLGDIARRLAANPHKRNAGFIPPYSTISVNRIQGGTAANILAAVCEFAWDIRALPGDFPTAILDELSAFANRRLAELLKDGKSCQIATTLLADVPALQAEAEGFAEDLVRRVLGETSHSICVPFCTEGGQFQRAGWSTIVCGPGSIDQAHRPDEFIEESELNQCEQFLDRLVAGHCLNDLSQGAPAANS